jgi:hypothetical protein
MPDASLQNEGTLHLSSIEKPDRQNKQSRFYLPQLDALRFFAFFAVFLLHTLPGIVVENHSGWWQPVALVGSTIQRSGENGIELFFLLSAYLITELLTREKRETGDIHLKMVLHSEDSPNMASVLFHGADWPFDSALEPELSPDSILDSQSPVFRLQLAHHVSRVHLVSRFSALDRVDGGTVLFDLAFCHADPFTANHAAAVYFCNHCPTVNFLQRQKLLLANWDYRTDRHITVLSPGRPSVYGAEEAFFSLAVVASAGNIFAWHGVLAGWRHLRTPDRAADRVLSCCCTCRKICYWLRNRADLSGISAM